MDNILYDAEKDKTGYKKSYNRREKLTLGKIAKLRRIREARKLQLMIDQSLSAAMFENPASGEENNPF